MNLRSLQALRAFMEGGSLNAAADRLNCTQPQVSRLLSRLEEDVGFPLFSRQVRRLVPTSEAREFYRQVEVALSNLDQVSDAAERVRSNIRNNIRILSAPDTLGALLLPSMRRLKAIEPTVSFSLDMRVRMNIDHLLRLEQFDLGITSPAVRLPELDVQEFTSVPFVAIMAPDHPLASKDVVRTEDLAGVPIICTGLQSKVRRELEARFHALGEPLQVDFESPSGPITCTLAASGLGVAIVDGFVALSHYHEPAVIRPFEPSITMDYAFVFPRWQERSDLVLQLGRFIKEEATNLLSRGLSRG